VLVSQGIESTIEYDESGVGWALAVAAPDLERALEAIRLYQLENRRWPWRRQLFEPGLLFDWASLAWVLLLGLFFWLDSHQIDLRSVGLMDRAAVAQGQWWRVFTATWLHSDITHFASNAVLGFVLLGLAMARYGTGVALLASYLAGAAGNLLVLVLPLGTHRSLGASGTVMGGLGLLAAQAFRLWRHSPLGRRYALTSIFGGVLLFVLLGLNPASDVLAHLGGFASGLTVGCLLALVPSMAQAAAANLASGFAFALLVLAPWWLALRSGV
jgi:membrane associated rhomboid family serine protease